MTPVAPAVHGAQIPSPKWWRRFRNIPLVIVAVLSVLAAVVGWTAQYQLDRENNALAPVPEAGSAGDDSNVCRPAVELPEQSPWVTDPTASATSWGEHQAELSGPVVEGENGWAFYNDQIEQNFSQAVGRRLLSVAEVTKWHDYFSAIADGLEKQGIELSIQITPSASSVYPGKLPAWAQDLRGPSGLDQLLLAAPELPIVDFRADLRRAAEDDAVYTPVNSHWTDWGGYIGWQTYASCHDELYPQNPPIVVPPVSGVENKGVFNEYASYGIADAEPEWTAPTFAEKLPDVSITDKDQNTQIMPGGKPVDLTLLPATTKNDHSASPQNALILRDSMGGALSTFWNQQYAQTWQIQHRYDDWSTPPNYSVLVSQYKPDVVIIQLAERHLVNAPPVTSGF